MSRGLRAEPLSPMPPVVGEVPSRRGGRRTRVVMATIGQWADTVNQRSSYPDAVTGTQLWSWRIPPDWVPGTDVMLHTYLRAGGTGTGVLWSYINAVKPGDTEAPYNIENNVDVRRAFTVNIIEEFVRTIDGTLLEADDALFWVLQRTGGFGTDTVNNRIDAFYGAWLEYTSWL